MNNQTINKFRALLDNGTLTKKEYDDAVAPKGFTLNPGYLQICSHSPEVLAKQTDPNKTYPTSYIEFVGIVTITDDTPQDENGNYLITFKGGLFDPHKGSPDFVIKSGSMTDTQLIPSTSKKPTSKATPKADLDKDIL